MQFMLNNRYEIEGTLFGLEPCAGGLYLRAGKLEAFIERVTYGGKSGDFGSEGWFEKWEDSSLNFRLFSWRLILDLPPAWRERSRRLLGFA